MSKTTRIGAACIEVGNDKQANLEVIVDYIEKAAKDGVQFLAFGECALQGYPLGLGHHYTGLDVHEQDRNAETSPGPSTDRLAEIHAGFDVYDQQRRDAETIPGPTTDLLATLAKRHEVEIVIGLTEQPTEPGSVGMLFNTVVAVGPNGVIAKYRKIHTGDVEKCLWNRGDEWVVAQTSVGKIGLMICYDLVFPETTRCLALEGAELLVMSTAWTSNHIREAYELFTRARPIENQIYLLVANLAGGPNTTDGPMYYGHSRIVNPSGHIVAETEGPGIAVADIDIPTGVMEARARAWWGLSHLANREPDVYSILSRKPGRDPARVA